MNDFYEILDFCGFDTEKAHKMAQSTECPAWVEEALSEVGLEKIQREPLSEIRR